jgi:CHAD domain-containing protein
MNEMSPLLSATLGEALRDLFAERLAQAGDACERLVKTSDEEALHDFRVAIRRLRSLQRAYGGWMGSTFKPRLRRALKQLAKTTNAGRDAEVLLAALEDLSARWTPAQRPGVQAFQERLQRRRDKAYAEVVAAIPPQFRQVGNGFEGMIDKLPARAGIPFVTATCEAWQGFAEDFLARLEAVGGGQDEAKLHALRIAGKRCRYLVEPFAELSPEAADLVRHFKRLQDCLGERHDLAVLGEALNKASGKLAGRYARQRISQALEAKQASTKDPMPGLLAVVKALKARRETLAQEWRKLNADVDWPAEFGRFEDWLDQA